MRASAASLLRASPACALRASRPGMLRATALRADAGPNPDPFIKGRLGILTDHNVERWAEMRMNMNREWEWNKKSTRMVLIYVFLVPVALYYFCDYTTAHQPIWTGMMKGEPLSWPARGTPEREEYFQAYLNGTLAQLHKEKVEAATAAAQEDD